MFPQRSGSQETLNGRLKLVPVVPDPDVPDPDVPDPDVPELLPAARAPDPLAEIAGDVDAIGNNAARATLTAALASRYCASACSTFWLETPTCSSSAFRAASLYNSHQRPFE